MTQSLDLKEDIRQAAFELGFHLFGVAPAEPLHEDADRLVEALAEGRLDPLRSWMAVDPAARADPRRFLDGARSVLMVGLSYAQSPPDLSGYSLFAEPTVARYALAEDYHRVIGEKLSSLEGFIGARLAPRSVCTRICVDTGPLLERAFARRAGLGFIGRNNCLIHPRYGSWFLLGALVTDLELEPDHPVEADCGSCTRCMDACPGGALVAPHRLDARRCVSCLTIETRCFLDDERRTIIGSRLFGCDVCQEVCPWNRNPLPCDEPALMPRHRDKLVSDDNPRLDAGYLRLEDVLAIPSNKVFMERLGHTPLLRARRRGLLRNALIAAAHLGRRDLLDRIQEMAGDVHEHDDVRRQAEAAALQIARSPRCSTS